MTATKMYANMKREKAEDDDEFILLFLRYRECGFKDDRCDNYDALKIHAHECEARRISPTRAQHTAGILPTCASRRLNINRLLDPIIQRIVKPQPLIQPTDTLQLALLQIPPRHVQILRQPPLVVALRDDGHVSLRRPAQQHLRGRLAVLFGDLLDRRVVQKQGRVFGALHVEFEEGLGPEGRVGCDGDALALGIFDETVLGEVWVVFDLEGGRGDLGVAEEVHEELAVEVADADGFGQTVGYELLHGRPGLLDGGVTRDDILAVVGKAGWVSLRRVHIFERDWEVDDVEIEVVDAPVLELFFADRLDAVVVVE